MKFAMISPIRLLVLSIIFAPLMSYAGIVPVVPGKIYTDPSGPAVVVGTSTAKTMVTMPTTSFGTHIDRFQQGVITFAVDHHYPTMFANSRIDVELYVRRFSDADTTTFVNDTTIVISVSDSPNDSLNFQDRQSISFFNIGSYSVKITDITVNGSSTGTLPANLFLQADLFIDRIYDFSSYVGTAPTINSTTSQQILDTDCDGHNDQLVLTWGVVPQAEEYQLEWVYINDYGPSSTPLSASALEVNYKINSTRISTTSNSYAITLAFDKGYVCYRVRAVGRNNTDLRKLIFSVWSTATDQVLVSATNSYHVTVPFEIAKNWQYSSTYAEEGKKKEVVSFFDGSLRNRQMVTKINSDNNTIVGETIYDHQGRPAVQVLPTPVNDPDCDDPSESASLKYYEHFTQNEADEPYTRADFDLSLEGDSCSTSTQGMGILSGAANYYSSSNPDLNGAQGYLPDAENFPFSQVEYTPDDTGRIRRQGGVGDDFKLGSGHETKYFYAHPFQEQLDRLFGSEVGISSHYQKNMVLDPNGQVSVSYFDQEGRVIATSLAGEKPENLEALPSLTEAQPITVDMFATDATGESTSNQLSVDGKSQIFNETVSFSAATTVELDYSLSFSPMTDTCVDFCFNCVYDLTIEIRNDCGELLTSPSLVDKHKGSFHVDHETGKLIFSTLCTEGPTTYTETASISVPMGTYQITKILTVNDESIDYFIGQYLDSTQNECLKTLADFEAEYLENANFEDCNLTIDCDSCVAALGTVEEFMAAGNGNQDDYEASIAACKAPCEGVSYCKTQEKLLLGDMSPGGQYAQYEQPDGSINTSTFPVSVLNYNNSLPQNAQYGVGTAYWTNPQLLIDGAFVTEYREADLVTRSKVWITVTFTSLTAISGTLPAVTTPVLNTNVFLDAATGNYYTYPEYLSNVSDFIAEFQPSWAYSLLKYHPEYSFYKTCLEFTVPVATDGVQTFTSESFDQKLLSISTWDDAMAAGFIPTGYTSLPYNGRIESVWLNTNLVYDPFLLSSSTSFSPYNSNLYNKIFNYQTIGATTYSMMEFAAMIMRCGNSLIGAAPGPTCNNFGDDITTPSTDPANDDMRNQEWQYFRSLYLSEKQQAQHQMSIDRSLTVSGFYGYNGCIQNDEFDPTRYNFLDFTNIMGGSIPASQYFSSIQPCEVSTNAYYISKNIRFVTPTDLIHNDPNEVAYQEYLLTGQCPVTSSLQNLLSEAAGSNLLESGSSFSMNDDMDYYAGLYLALNDYAVTGPIPATDWVQTSMTSTSLSVDFMEGSTVVGSFTLSKLVGEPVSFTWADILSFHSLSFTTGAYNFTIIANVQTGSGAIVPVHLNGITSYNIANCSFSEVCELSDVGKDLEVLIKAIASAGELGSTGYGINGTDLEDLFTPVLANAIGNYTTPDPKWVFDPAVPEFYLIEQNTANVWHFAISLITPSSFSLGSIGSIASVTSVDANQGNTFDIVCADGSGNHLVTFTCLSQQHGYGFPVGSCDLPDPVLCEGVAYTNSDLFGDLLLSLTESGSIPGSIDYALIDDNLTGQLGTEFDGFTVNTYTSEGFEYIDLTGNTTCPIQFKIDETAYPYLHFTNIEDIIGIHTVGTPDNYGNYHELIIDVSYSALLGGGGPGEVHVTTCLPLKVCVNCIDTVTLFNTPEQEARLIAQRLKSGELIAYPSVENYNKYVTAIEELNKRFGWTSENGLAITPISYKELFSYGMDHDVNAYLDFINGFNPKTGNVDYLKNPLLFGAEPSRAFIEEGSGEPTEKECRSYWDSYHKAIETFNTSSWASAHGITLVDLYPDFDEFMATGKCRCLEEYLAYIEVYLYADSGTELPDPVSLDEFCNQSPCQKAYDQYLNCVVNFNDWAMNNGYTDLVIIGLVKESDFIDSRWCYCVDAYCAALFDIMNLKQDRIRMPDFKTLCGSNKPPCTPDVPFTANVIVPEEPFMDPCTEFITNMAYSNALNAYTEYINEMTADIRERYIQHCMAAAETMTLTYNEAEYHFTLYYYDQAGNLIKTVPPEGVEVLDLSVVQTQIKHDRAYGTHSVVTNHRMATKYEYNSLNQLVAQSMPDQDNMDVFEITLPNGLIAGLNTTAIQMVSENIGYLTGYMNNSTAPMGSRGYLYRTDNGGSNWKRVYYTLGDDLKKVRMIGTTHGYAVGDNGILLRSVNGAVTWDLVNTYGSSLTGDIVDLDITSTGDVVVLWKDGNYAFISSPTTSYTLGSPSTIGIPSGTTLVTAKAIQRFGTKLQAIISITDGTNTFDFITKVGPLASPYNLYGAEWDAVYYYGTDLAMVAGEDGNVASLSDASTFDQRMLISGLTGSVLQLYFLNENRGIANVSNLGSTNIFVTYNKGTTWTKVDETLNAQLGFIDQTSTKLELFTQTSTITQRLILNATNDLIVIDQTPVTPTSTSFVSVSSDINTATSPATITYYGIDASGQLYKSNGHTLANAPVTYTLVHTLSSITPKKLLVSRITGYIYFVVLADNGQMKKIQFNTTTSTYTDAVLSSAHSGYAFSDVMINKNSGSPYMMAYDDVNRILNYLSLTSTTSAQTLSDVATTTTMTSWPAASTIKALAMNGNAITLVGKAGRLFTTSAFTTGSPTVTISNRSSLYYSPLNDLIDATYTGVSMLAVGDNGALLEYLSSAPSSELTVGYYTIPLGHQTDINGVVNTGSQAIVVGDKGYAEAIDLSTFVRTAFTTLTGMNIPAAVNYKNLYGVVAKTNIVYFFGEDGALGFSRNYLTTPFGILANPNGKDFYGGDLMFDMSLNPPKLAVVGEDSRIFRYLELSGSEIKDLFSPKYNDVHFANVQMGTVVGNHYLLRKTTDGGITWKTLLPAASEANSNINNLLKVWTKAAPNGNYFAVTGGVSYLTSIGSAGFTPTTFNATVADFGFRNSNTGYVLANAVGGVTTTNALRNINFTPATNTYTVSVSSDLVTTTYKMNALHIFDNQDVMVVGVSDQINHYTVGATSYTSFTGSATGTFNDVYFHDNSVGYIVGDGGKFYRATSTSINPVTHEVYGLNLVAKDLSDGVVTTGTQSSVNIKALAFGSRYRGVFGGSFAPSTFTSANKPYVRSLFDQSDEFTSRFYYDRLGRIVVSQNSRQKNVDKYSYTLYDALGRVYEAGEKAENTTGGNPVFEDIFGAYVGGILVQSVIDDEKLADWLTSEATTTRKEVTKSYYDFSNIAINNNGLGAYYGFNLDTQRKRIVHVTYEDVYDADDATYDHATHYDYDIHGNVKTLVQDNPKLGAITDLAQHRFKRMDYNYDLISGNVHRMDYESGNADQWHHAYTYDADNRITKVYTTSTTPLLDPQLGQASANNEPELNPMWDKEAEYLYYAHGPLARTVIGDQEVQGVDYVYTLQGWIKGVNSNTLDDTRDPGLDGSGLSANHNVAKDVYGYSLHYFGDDYVPAASGNGDFVADQTGSDIADYGSVLYNGNIGRMVTTITHPDTRDVLPLGMGYQYDQLNRLVMARGAIDIDLGGNAWNAASSPDLYYNNFSYDANGNILFQSRADESATFIDYLTYKYELDGAGKRIRNRLYHVDDIVSPSAYPDDIDDMGTFVTGSTINTANNYVYDEEGRLIKDVQEGITNIVWRVDGKVKSITQDGSHPTHSNIIFDYDAMGHRIAKHVYDSSTDDLKKSTYYMLNAQGNTIAVYEREIDNTTENITFEEKERYIYGSSRLGVNKESVPMLGTQNNNTIVDRALPMDALLMNTVGDVPGLCSSTSIAKWFYEVSGTTGSVMNNIATFSGHNTSLNVMTVQVTANVTPGETYTLHYDLSDWTNLSYLHCQVRECNSAIDYAVVPVSVNGSYQITFTVPPGSDDMVRIKWYGIETLNSIPMSFSLSSIALDGAGVQFSNDTEPAVDPTVTHTIGLKNYELSNHLGNVLSVVSDKVIPIESDATTEVLDADFTTTFPTYMNGDPWTTFNYTGGRLQFGNMLNFYSLSIHLEPYMTVDHTYKVRFTIDLDGAGDIIATVKDSGVPVAAPLTCSSNGTYEIEFSSTGSSLSDVRLFLMSAGTAISPRDIYVDDVILEELSTDVTGFLADIIQSTDYSPFGVELSGRNFLKTGVTDDFRFGYQGSEKDDEVKGNGNSYTTEFRQLDPRLGRWLSVDPKAGSMPWQSPYCSMDNNPINLNDPMGDISGGMAPPGEKSAKGDKSAWAKYTKSGQSDKYVRVLAPNGTWKEFKRAHSSFTYSDGKMSELQIKKAGVWSITNDEGQFLWDNVAGKYVKNTSGKQPGQNGTPLRPGTTTYAGGNNPEKYSQPAQNLADQGGKVHDQDYDKKELAGAKGVVSPNSFLANAKLSTTCAVIMMNYHLGAIDPYTGAKISPLTYGLAREMYLEFNTIETLKTPTNISYLGYKVTKDALYDIFVKPFSSMPSFTPQF